MNYVSLNQWLDILVQSKLNRTIMFFSHLIKKKLHLTILETILFVVPCTITSHRSVKTLYGSYPEGYVTFRSRSL